MSVLKPGFAWRAHCGKRAQARYLRQRERAAAKKRKHEFGVEVSPDGRTPAGLIVPSVEIRRIAE